MSAARWERENLPGSALVGDPVSKLDAALFLPETGSWPEYDRRTCLPMITAVRKTNPWAKRSHTVSMSRSQKPSNATQPPNSMNLNSAIGCEQQRREDAKKELGDGKLQGGFRFTGQVKGFDFGEKACIALYSAFASSRLRCSTAASRMITRWGCQVCSPPGRMSRG